MKIKTDTDILNSLERTLSSYLIIDPRDYDTKSGFDIAITKKEFAEMLLSTIAYEKNNRYPSDIDALMESVKGTVEIKSTPADSENPFKKLLNL